MVDVTSTPKLWSTFLREFENLLSKRGSHQLAIQPHWQVYGDWETCKRTSSPENVLIWHDGCAGKSCYGGGNSGVCLQLKGLMISSKDTEQSVFWIRLNSEHIDVLKGIRGLLSYSTSRIVVWDLKWWIRVCNELLGVDTRDTNRFYDPGIQGWMEDPDSGRPRLVDMLSNASKVIDALFSMGYHLGAFMISSSFHTEE